MAGKAFPVEVVYDGTENDDGVWTRRHPANHAVTFEYDWDSDQSLLLAIVHGIASLKDVDPLALSPLYASIDINNVDRLFRSVPPANRPETTVEFVHDDCTVCVSGSGEIRLELT